MDQRPFLIKFTGASVNKTIGRVLFSEFFRLSWIRLSHEVIPHPPFWNICEKIMLTTSRNKSLPFQFNIFFDGTCNWFPVRNVKHLFGLFCKSCLLVGTFFFWIMHCMNSLCLTFVVEQASIFCLDFYIY